MQNSGIESLVEELCSKLKDIQNKQKGLKLIFFSCSAVFAVVLIKKKSQMVTLVRCFVVLKKNHFPEEKRIQKKSDGCQSPERADSPSSKDQVEM